MQTFLQFTRAEYRAIARACRPLELSDASFRSLKPYLVRAVAAEHPALAERLAQFRTYQVGILYEYLRERRRRAGRLRSGDGLTVSELRAVRLACGAFVAHPRFMSSLRLFLVHRFRSVCPGLARKLGRLSDHQVERLYEQVQPRNGGEA